MTRPRITITLEKNILKQLDKVIDGVKIRNRSHAIEYILSKNFLPKVTKVVILAGGKGLKMRPFTYELPKAMMPIHNKPALEYTLENLRKYDLREVIVSIGHLGEKIKSYFGDGKKCGIQITYNQQTFKIEKGTALPLAKIKGLLAKNPFILIYGDVLADIDLLDMIEFHNSHSGLATMALTSVGDTSGWGVVELMGNRISSFNEKPKKKTTRSHIINAGIYIFNPEVLDLINNKTPKLEEHIFPKLVRAARLYGYHFSGDWFDIGTPASYEKALKGWQKR